jgi:ATP adenylyltransferase
MTRGDAEASDCQICAKHRGEGPLGGELVAQLDGFWVYHAPPAEDGRAPLGYLFIESDRHAPYVDDLTEEEASALGRLRTRLVGALRREISPEHVFAAVVGRGVSHFHEHLIPRYADTPQDVPWHRSDEFAPGATQGEVADLVHRLQRRLASAAR